jgi:hypothetical protein
MRIHRVFVSLMIVLPACSSLPPKESSQAPLSRERLVAEVPGSQMERVGQSGGVRRWVNHADGTANITRLARPGAKATSIGKASGKWSISQDGKYCLEEDWSVEAGGSFTWCSRVYKDDAGALRLVHAN